MAWPRRDRDHERHTLADAAFSASAAATSTIATPSSPCDVAQCNAIKTGSTTLDDACAAAAPALPSICANAVGAAVQSAAARTTPTLVRRSGDVSEDRAPVERIGARGPNGH